MCMHTKRLIGWLRGEPKDRRRTGRHLSPGLYASYWDGAEPVQKAILDISGSGAFIKSSQQLYPKTIVSLSLKMGKEESEDVSEYLVVHACVTRVTSTGVGVKFLFLNASQQREFEGLLEDFTGGITP